MKRRFTILTAALALLVMMTLPEKVVGQYSLATSISVGDVVVLVNNDVTKELGGISTTSTKYGLASDVSNQSPAGLYPLTVVAGNSESSYAFKTTDNKYLTWTSGNSLNVAASLSDNSSWTVSINANETHVATISNVATTERQIKYNGNSGQERFACYTSGQNTVLLYKLDASLLDNDLALNPASLSLDMYANPNTGTIYYTTSSTGAVTVSTSDYVTTSVNPTAKTITVTPTAVTPSAQTITVNQAADDNYAAGSKTFTINITDSTPFTGGDVTFNATIDKGTSPLVKQGVTFSCTNGVLNNGSEYRLYKNSVTTFSVSEGTITQIAFTGVSGNPASGFATQTGWTTDGNNGTWIGNAQEVSFTASGAQVRATLIVVTVDMDGAPAPTITAEDVNIAYDAEEGTINYTINNPVEGGSIVASTEAEWLMVDDEAQTDAEGSIYFTCYPNSNFYAHSATVTLTYSYGDSKTTVTKDVTVTQALDPDANGSTIDYPIMVSEAIEAIDEVGSVSNIYVGGIVSNIETEYSSQYHNITFDMIDEEGDEYFVRAYRCVSTDDVDASEVAVGDYVIVKGDLMLYNSSNGSIYELAQGCQLVSLIHPVVPSITVYPDEVNVDAEEHDGTLALTYENLVVSSFEDFLIQFYDANGNELNSDNEPDWIEVNTAEDGDDLLVSYFMLENGGLARTAYFKVATLVDDDLVYSNLVTISQAAPIAPATGGEYALYTGELVEGDYLIVYDGGAMNTTVTSDRLQYEDVTVNNNVITTDNAAIVWHIAPSGQYWTIYNANADAYAASTGVKNKAQMLADGTDDKALWTVSGTETYEFVNKKNSESNVNANLRKNGTYGFACYATSTGGALSLYKKVEPTPAGIPLEIAADQWYLISSPVGTINLGTAQQPTNNVGNLTTGTYGLYSFDQTGGGENGDGKEWRNYKAGAFSELQAGKGYLYINQEGCNLTFTGTANNNSTAQAQLVYSTSNETESFHGLNLIGNPLNATAYLEDGRPFYVMNGNVLAAANRTDIAPMEGVFVVAENANDNSVTFTTTQPTNGGKGVVLNLSQNRGSFEDRAIVRFGEGSQLPKVQLFETNADLYIPQGDQNYAVVRSEGQGELPVNFRASENGTYTLSMDVENMDMNYLHLIDNMTGMDVDLLQTPSYTFEAKVNDYESRFRLVFAANNKDGVSTGSTTFAFYSNGNWIINNASEATLQVVDLTGRILSSETVNGSVSKTINAVPGVYMLRLINGDNVNVQKIVVR